MGVDPDTPGTQSPGTQSPGTQSPGTRAPGTRAPRSSLYRRVAHRYGAGPLHLLALLSSFAFAGYIAERIVPVGGAPDIGIWFVGALLGHDLFLFPLYALADRSAGLGARRHPERLPAVPWVNHLRAPSLVAGVLLLVSFPLIFKLDPNDYHYATGLLPGPYLARWLLITAGLFFVSAVIYALRVAHARAQQTVPGG